MHQGNFHSPYCRYCMELLLQQKSIFSQVMFPSITNFFLITKIVTLLNFLFLLFLRDRFVITSTSHHCTILLLLNQWPLVTDGCTQSFQGWIFSRILIIFRLVPLLLVSCLILLVLLLLLLRWRFSVSKRILWTIVTQMTFLLHHIRNISICLDKSSSLWSQQLCHYQLQWNTSTFFQTTPCHWLLWWPGEHHPS